MDAAIATDVERLNTALFSVIEGDEGKSLILEKLGASAPVIERIAQRTPSGQATAIRCEVPLVTFSSLLEERLLGKPSEWPQAPAACRGSGRHELAHIALGTAYRAIRLYPDLGQTYFGLTPLSSNRLVELAQTDLFELGRSEGILLALRGGSDVVFWDRLLIGDRLSGPRAQWISTNTAFLSLGQGQ